jgi:uncharacterized OB-fold protein
VTEAVRIPGEWHIRYNYTIGNFAAAFFEAIREKKILGSLCAETGEIAVPPKSFDERAFVPTDKLVDIGLDGTIEAVSIVTAPFAGSPPVPYAVAYVKLDGATSSVANYVRNVDLGDGESLPNDLRIGSPVHVVFTDEPAGKITDFWFEPGPLGPE